MMRKFMNILKLAFLFHFMYFCLYTLDIQAQSTRVVKEEYETIYHMRDRGVTTCKIIMSPLNLQLNGDFCFELPSCMASNKSIYMYDWSRKITLSLPKGIKRLYRFPELVVNYNSGAVVWASVDDRLQKSSSSYNINATYKDGIYNPSYLFIDSLADVARTKIASYRLLGDNIGTYIAYMKHIKRWFKTDHSYYDFKDNKLCDRWGEYKYERLLSCLPHAKKDRKSILSIKDGIFVLAYNIPEIDYPIFDAYIRNTFSIKNRLMEFIDISEDDGISEKGLAEGWRNLTKKFYLYYRLYEELPTVTPPDSTEYKRLIFRDITDEPDTFLLARPKPRCY